MLNKVLVAIKKNEMFFYLVPIGWWDHSEETVSVIFYFYKSSGINRSLYKVKHIQHFLSDYSVVIKWTIICFCFSWVYLEDLWFLNAELTGVHDFIVVIEHHFSCWCVVRLLFGFQSVLYEVLETILCLLIHFTYSFQICFNPTKRIS